MRSNKYLENHVWFFWVKYFSSYPHFYFIITPKQYLCTFHKMLKFHNIVTYLSENVSQLGFLRRPRVQLFLKTLNFLEIVCEFSPIWTWPQTLNKVQDSECILLTFGKNARLLHCKKMVSSFQASFCSCYRVGQNLTYFLPKSTFFVLFNLLFDCRVKAGLFS